MFTLTPVLGNYLHCTYSSPVL